MSEATAVRWTEANQRYLLAALAVVRDALTRHAARAPERREVAEDETEVDAALRAAAADMPAPPALERLSSAFGLSGFERSVLVLCAAIELDATFASLCASAHGEAGCAYPTFGLALAALPAPHWSALTPGAPLRRWRLVEVTPGSLLTTAALRIDERVLHYLTGVDHLDEHLTGLVDVVRGAGADLVPSHRALAEQLITAWSEAMKAPELPVLQLGGDDVGGKRSIAAAVCAGLGLKLGAMSAHVVPVAATEMETLVRLWEREAVLSGSALLLECDGLDGGDATRAAALARFIARVPGPLFVASRDRRSMLERAAIAVDVPRPAASEQRSVWRSALGARADEVNGHLDHLVSQFRLSAPTIRAACAEALGSGDGTKPRGPADPRLPARLWDACRKQARPRLDDLAQRIEVAATWNDLVLPDAQRQTLAEIAVHVRQRATVYDTWGFAAKSARGLGISALFTGPSGTGKTMAAEVLAHELRLDLYRIDLSQVVSKYIGETEKNLRRVFDAAEDGGVILLFDEADALFGKRSEVRDSHDRYANIEVSYLLQRMEAHQGLAILTSNMKSALDPAFLRRLRFVVSFPFPDTAQRAAIWQRVFPAHTPVEGLEMTMLARLNVAGGHIRNIALNAAFLAADAGEPVRMAHVVRAARSEYAKLEKPLTDIDAQGWA
jgi:hypothetical protein